MRKIVVDSDHNAISVNGTIGQNISVLYDKLIPLTPDLGLLPPVVRYISPIAQDGTSTIIVEAKPRVHMWCIRINDDENQYVYTPLPWFHWFFKVKQDSDSPSIFNLVEIRLAFSRTQLLQMDHQFFSPYAFDLAPDNDPIYKNAGKKVDIPVGYNIGNPHKKLNVRDFNNIYNNILDRFWNHALSGDTEVHYDLLNMTELMFPSVKLTDLVLLSFLKMYHNTSLDEMFAFLDSEEFNTKFINDDNQIIFANIVDLLETPRPVDIMAVFDELEKHAKNLPLPSEKKLSYPSVYASLTANSSYSNHLAYAENAHASIEVVFDPEAQPISYVPPTPLSISEPQEYDDDDDDSPPEEDDSTDAGYWGLDYGDGDIETDIDG